ncbi:MAG: polysaccharide deacetylase family protein [Deltaproteobacteria bacterium]|nr:polysaccharide deacetylase family protein [Deltaproteobacteria bacterium]
MRVPRLRLRRRIADLLERAGVAGPVLRARPDTPWLTVLTYHRVRDAIDDRFDDGVTDATGAELDAHVGALARDFTFVGIDDLLRWIAGAPLPKSPLLITFDDGYRECVDVALPILQRHGARAVFFLATHYVEQRRVFWWDRAAFLVKNAAVSRARLREPAALDLDLADGREASLRAVLRVIKDRPGLDLERFLEALADACRVSWSSARERSFADELVMTWSDARALVAAGMDVQSHTRTHRVLQTVPDAELASELEGSRLDLERALGVPIRALAYPTGRPIRDRPAIEAAVRAAGYRLAFVNDGGVTLRWPRANPLGLRRIPMRQGLSSARLQALVALPFLA